MPTLMVAGDGDIMSDVPSTRLTFDALGSRDKTLMRFGKAEGHVADYGHCDLVWSRHAPSEIFPPAHRLARRPPARRRRLAASSRPRRRQSAQSRPAGLRHSDKPSGGNRPFGPRENTATRPGGDWAG